MSVYCGRSPMERPRTDDITGGSMTAHLIRFARSRSAASSADGRLRKVAMGTVAVIWHGHDSDAPRRDRGVTVRPVDAVERSDDPAVGQMLKEHIERFNMATTGITEWHQVTYVVRDDDGELAGGIDGWEWGGTCFVAALWVREDRRGRGIGSALMAALEQEATRLGCHQIALETHTFQAPAFYERRGYARVGEVGCYPRGHSLISLAKPLS
jgi:GNAT superfamily N-acetyltransferase